MKAFFIILPPILWGFRDPHTEVLQLQALSKLLRISFTSELFKILLSKCCDVELNDVSDQIFNIVFELATVVYLVAGTFMIIENSA